MISKDQGNKDVKLTLKKIINLIPHLMAGMEKTLLVFLLRVLHVPQLSS